MSVNTNEHRCPKMPAGAATAGRHRKDKKFAGKPLQLTLDGQVCTMRPFEPRIAKLFTYRHHLPAISGTAIRQCRRPLCCDADQGPFLDPDDNDLYLAHLAKSSQTFPEMVTGGLLAPLAVAAAKNGYRPKFVIESLCVERNQSASAEIECSHVLDFIERHSHGLIRHSLDSSDLSRLIGHVAQSFPKARIAVVGLKRQWLQSIYGKLSNDLKHQVTLADADDSPEFQLRVLLGTPFALRSANHLDRPYDIILLLDATEIANDRLMQTAIYRQRSRLYGLLPFETALPPRTKDLVFAAFGPMETLLSAFGRRVRCVETVFGRLDSQFSTLRASEWELIHTLIQQNQGRNSLVAAIAHGLAEGVPPTAQLNRRLPKRYQRRMNTVVLVDGVEHAARLGNILRKWSIVVDDGANLDGLPTNGRFRTVDGYSGHPPMNMIATSATAARLKWDRCDAVIWAGGGYDGPRLSHAQLSCPTDVNRPLLLVDINDRHHQQLRRQTVIRHRHYDDRDWFPLGANPAARRTQRYWRESGAAL